MDLQVGYWPDQPVVCSRVVASFFPIRAMPTLVVGDLPVEVSPVMLCLSDGTVKLWFCVVFITYLYPSYGCIKAYCGLVELCSVEAV
ncbi:hypothetical protein Taro_003517 [Colocasia esculenta]|uniref:Uncharacterized protein n=1 Tax=Colocasia esculenta TaxID=4460 RepID=A0A843TFM4_COLES|nr:hypothetical protein [Colocasia esculenta]